MTLAHMYPSTPPAVAAKILATSPYAVPQHRTYERATPHLTEKRGEAAFVYGDALERTLREVAKSFADKLTETIPTGSPMTVDPKRFFEQQCSHSVAWYEQLKNLPVAVVEDDGFWRYLTVAVLGAEEVIRKYIKDKDMHIGAVNTNVNADGSTKRSSDILAKRMFVRGRLYRDHHEGGPPKTGQEFETSHVYPGNMVDTRAAWQKAMYAAHPEPLENERRAMVKGRDRAIKVNAARSARVAVATEEAEAAEIVKELLQKPHAEE